MPPREIGALLKWLDEKGEFGKITANMITQWGPRNRRMLSPEFLPPRVIAKNQDTLERVHFRTVAAVDGTRHSPAQLVDSGEMFGRMHYRFGNSDLMRQITGPDYEAIVNYLNINAPMLAIGRVLGIFESLLINAMVEHDEMANWDAIVFNKVTRRGDNAYWEYEEGPDLDGHRVQAGGDWTDPTYDPWTGDIIPRIRFLTRLGYERSGIRIVTSDAILQVLAENPFTMRRAYGGGPLFEGQTLEERSGPTTDTDVDRVFRKLKVQAPITHDLIIFTKTGQRRAYPEDHMTFIASTGRPEEIMYTVEDKAKVRIVQNTLGFSGIGTAANQLSPGRRTASQAFTNQKNAHVHFQGWQSTGPVILEPTAITDIGGIETDLS